VKRLTDKGLKILLSCLFLILFFASVNVSAAERDFIISFGNGGLSTYTVVDNACYVYTLHYPADERQLSQLMNNVLTSSVASARRQYAKDNDGFINIKIVWQFLGKERIVYQICGDIVKKGGK
jgi:hypothetical protein